MAWIFLNFLARCDVTVALTIRRSCKCCFIPHFMDAKELIIRFSFGSITENFISFNKIRKFNRSLFVFWPENIFYSWVLSRNLLHFYVTKFEIFAPIFKKVLRQISLRALSRPHSPDQIRENFEIFFEKQPSSTVYYCNKT